MIGKRQVNDRYSRAPRDIERALAAAVRIADFLPDPASLKRATKMPVTLRIDPDVVDWFKRDGPGYQTRINGVLRAYMLAKGRK